MTDEPCVHERDADPAGPLFRFFFLTGLPCSECEREAHAAWVQAVRARLAAGLEAAAAGERFDWDAPGPADEPRFALVRLDDRLDLALAVDGHGRCTVPASGRYNLGRVTTLQEAVDAERYERVMRRVRDGVMTLNQAKAMYGRPQTTPGNFNEIEAPQREAAEQSAAQVRAYIAEDEAVARDVENKGEWFASRHDHIPLVQVNVVTADGDGCLDEYVAADVGRSDGVHIARHDPARVLDQCGALGDVLTELERIAERSTHPDPRMWARGAIDSLVRVWEPDEPEERADAER